MKSLLAVCMTALIGTGALAQNATGAANPQLPLGAPLNRPQPVSPLPSAAPMNPSAAPLVQPVAPAPAGTSPLADAAKSDTKSATARRSTRKTQMAAAGPDGAAEPRSATSKKAATKKKARKHKKSATSAATGADATGGATPAPTGKTAKASKKKLPPNDGSRP